MSGQTLTDRIAAAQYSVTGSAVARAVCKATTHEVMGPKKKHLEYLIQATNETNVNIPQMADTLFERATNSSWVVVFKALVTTHHLMVQGNERFIQYLASRNTLFNLSNFLDKTGSHGYDMSTFIRRYSRYMNEKAFAYRQMAFDFGRVKKGVDGVMRTMTPEKLLKGMPILQGQIDALLEFDQVGIDKGDIPDLTYGSPTTTSPTSTPAKSSDGAPAVDLFSSPSSAAASNASNNLLDLQPDFSSAQPAGAAAAPAASSAWGGISNNHIPHLHSSKIQRWSSGSGPVFISIVSSSFKPDFSSAQPAGAAAAPAASSAWGDSLMAAPVPAHASASESLLSDPYVVEASPTPTPTPTEIPPAPAPATATTPIAAAAAAPPVPTTAASTSGDMDLFGDLFDSMPEPNASTAPKQDVTPSIDLFATVDAFSAPSAAPAAASPAKPDTAGVLDLFGDAFGGSSAEPQPATAASSADLLSGLGGAFMVPSPATASPAPAQNNLMQPSFDAAFGTTPTATSSGFDSSVFDGLEDLLMPTMTPQGQGAGAGLGGIAGVQSGKALAGDLNSSLANLAGNLGIAGTQKKDLQWNAGERKLTGGVNWQPKVAPATWGTPGSQMTGAVPPGGVPPVGGVTPVGAAPPVGAIPPMGAVQPQPGFGMPPAAGAGAPMMPQSSMMYPQPMMRPPFGASASPGAPLSPSPTPATQSPKKPPTKDPLADLNIKDFL
ncbi:UNVERIFIED_CONTAM: hypothetical protein FKN15_040012 [Acipenser sinensis]